MRLEQVVANLLTNAAKYTEPGGHIRVSVRPEDGSAVLSVRDTGIGIDPEKLPRLFDLYEQLGVSEARSRGGLGIGLPLVKRLVEAHQGTVTARSEGPGKGSEFTVTFPLLPPSEGASA
jgi:signal transduction histidine kinase